MASSGVLTKPYFMLDRTVIQFWLNCRKFLLDKTARVRPPDPLKGTNAGAGKKPASARAF
jgi:hypothetical protein